MFVEERVGRRRALVTEDEQQGFADGNDDDLQMFVDESESIGFSEVERLEEFDGALVARGEERGDEVGIEPDRELGRDDHPVLERDESSFDPLARGQLLHDLLGGCWGFLRGGLGFGRGRGRGRSGGRWGRG